MSVREPLLSADSVDYGTQDLDNDDNGTLSPVAGQKFAQSEVSDEKSRGEFIAYKRRWYILFLYSLVAFTQSMGWNTWGPIASSAKLAYGWSNGMISLLAAWGPIAFMSTVFLYSWLIETKGLRWAALIGTGSLTLGTGVRCITTHTPYVTWLMNFGQICCSITGPLAMAAQTAVSATWFPPSQRTTATAISGRVMGLGAGVAFIIGPLLVTDVGDFSNSTSTNRSVLQHTIRGDIQRLMFIELAWTALLFVAMVVYFPAKPPTPPSLSIAKRDVNFKEGLKGVFKKPNFWLLGLPYAVAYGIMIGWSAVLDVNLQPLGIDQKEAGWIGIYGSLAALLTGIGLARVVDILKGKTKPALLVLYLLATGGTLLFALACSKYIPYLKPSLYVGRIVGAACMSAMVPLVFETLCETCYPVPESVTNAVLTHMKNFWVLVFLSILWIPGVGTLWMNWMVVGGAVLCIPLVIAFKETHGRLNVDYSEIQHDDSIN